MKRVIFSIFTILLIVSSGYFIYKSYAEYKNYQTIQNSEQNIKILKNLDGVLRQIENELTLSALYLASDGKTDFNVLQNARIRIYLKAPANGADKFKPGRFYKIQHGPTNIILKTR